MPLRLFALGLLPLLMQLPGWGEDSGHVYVYARRETEARSWIKVSCGGAVAAEVRQGTFFALSLPPGRYSLSVDGGVPLPIEAIAGNDAFVRLDWHYEEGRPPVPALSKVRPEDAAREMRFLAYVPARRLHSTQAARTDPRAPSSPQWKRREGQ
ncbi:MAG: hypothetical protein J0H49_00200 [Acidobacteria bacterium]|nr:hypothetical protein [Acidobacteriota bacterium]